MVDGGDERPPPVPPKDECYLTVTLPNGTPVSPLSIQEQRVDTEKEGRLVTTLALDEPVSPISAEEQKLLSTSKDAWKPSPDRSGPNDIGVHMQAQDPSPVRRLPLPSMWLQPAMNRKESWSPVKRKVDRSSDVFTESASHTEANAPVAASSEVNGGGKRWFLTPSITASTIRSGSTSPTPIKPPKTGERKGMLRGLVESAVRRKNSARKPSPLPTSEVTAAEYTLGRSTSTLGLEQGECMD